MSEDNHHAHKPFMEQYPGGVNIEKAVCEVFRVSMSRAIDMEVFRNMHLSTRISGFNAFIILEATRELARKVGQDEVSSVEKKEVVEFSYAVPKNSTDLIKEGIRRWLMEIRWSKNLIVAHVGSLLYRACYPRLQPKYKTVTQVREVPTVTNIYRVYNPPEGVTNDRYAVRYAIDSIESSNKSNEGNTQSTGCTKCSKSRCA